MTPEDLNAFIEWILCRIASMDHGCLTGDCPHGNECDCVKSIRESYEESYEEPTP